MKNPLTSRIHASYLLFILAALAEVFVLNACGRSEQSSNDPTTPATQSLQLITLYSMSVTEPSGLLYSPKTRQLYMVSDSHGAIYVIDTTGLILQTIPVDAQDLEGIALTQNADTFYVAEETRSQITSFLPDGTKLASFPITVRTNTKHGPEGLTIDGTGNLWIINEKLPTMLLHHAGSAELSRTTLTFTTDISDICYDSVADAFWIVSDESQSVIKISRTGALLGQWSTPVTQGEGIAFIGNRMYIVSDTDAKLYVFVKPS
jgi:uncharacterized protein YjiK